MESPSGSVANRPLLFLAVLRLVAGVQLFCFGLLAELLNPQLLAYRYTNLLGLHDLYSALLSMGYFQTASTSYHQIALLTRRSYCLNEEGFVYRQLKYIRYDINNGMDENDKPLIWLHGEIKTPPFSQEGRIEAGVLLRRLQQGERLGMPHAKPMLSIETHCHELRIRDVDKNWRIIYRIDDDAILILEVFNKTTRTTPTSVIDTCKKRLSKYDLDIQD